MTRHEDMAGRVLAVVVRALPFHRKDWGQAMRAELAAITEGPARRQFVRGCTRAVLLSGTALRTLAGYVGMLVFAAVILRQTADLPSAGVRVEAIGLIAVITVLAWCGRRRGALGPAGIDLVPRLIRLAGYAAVMTTVAVLLTTGTNDPTGWWLAALAVGVYLTGFLRATTQPAADALSLPIAATLTLVGLAVWWVPMLLLIGVRAAPILTFLVACALVPAGTALGSRTGSPIKGTLSGLAAAAVTLLLFFLAAVLTYRLAPGLVPDIAGPGDAGGLTPAAKAETNQIESIDPYVADFLLGAVLSGILTAVSVRRRPGVATGIRRFPGEVYPADR
ncbi:hypothetical protein [Actinocrispum wychmicini]|uniref:Uncharacterized protein n=1 Tax=Actinocrispum wychmicini TaxID=1213861 RepID=A0A4R2JXQ8_9PSEU|nr:hypothetical protein [Actinocrispum wychmicini]TCO62208.1 hypothetical protein EV192_102345 [Actinocrispum wychmicini]